MPTTTKLTNLAIIIDSIEGERESSLREYALNTGIEKIEFFTKNSKHSAKKFLLEKFRKLLSQENEITNEQIQKLETEFDLIIKVGKNSCNLEDTIIIGSSYAEIYFADITPQDFDQSQLTKAIEDFTQRKRNFGV